MNQDYFTKLKQQLSQPSYFDLLKQQVSNEQTESAPVKKDTPFRSLLSKYLPDE